MVSSSPLVVYMYIYIYLYVVVDVSFFHIYICLVVDVTHAVQVRFSDSSAARVLWRSAMWRF